ncbi:MAG: response regulator [Coriobacteriia bacterium]|nr:response regulator [Coriobacteriia bacterium]
MAKAKKILVIDDEPMVVKMVSDVLISRGLEVITAPEGYEGLLKAISEHPDLILLDVVMPGLDGHEVLARLHKDARTTDIPVVFLTAVGDFDEQLHSMDEGISDYITKPIRPSEVADRVEEFLDPARRAAAEREGKMKAGKLRTIVEIMHREHKE